MKAFNEELAIIGIYPPPYGGVSIHLKRLAGYLDEQEVDYVFYNTGPATVTRDNIVNVGWSLWWYLKLLLFGKHKVIHCHTGRWWVRVCIGLVGIFGKSKVIFTAHSFLFCEDFLEGNLIRRFLQKFILRRAGAIVATNDIILGELIKIGVPDSLIHVIPAFIPPPVDSCRDDIPPEVQTFCRGKSPILTAAGAFVLRHGEDIYGLKMMVNMI